MILGDLALSACLFSSPFNSLRNPYLERNEKTTFIRSVHHHLTYGVTLDCRHTLVTVKRKCIHTLVSVSVNKVDDPLNIIAQGNSQDSKLKPCNLLQTHPTLYWFSSCYTCVIPFVKSTLVILRIQFEGAPRTDARNQNSQTSRPFRLQLGSVFRFSIMVSNCTIRLELKLVIRG